jgi:hypothetical protein
MICKTKLLILDYSTKLVTVADFNIHGNYLQVSYKLENCLSNTKVDIQKSNFIIQMFEINKNRCFLKLWCSGL